MENTIVALLREYCERRGIKLQNFEEIAGILESDLSEVMIPTIVKNHGDLVKESENEE